MTNIITITGRGQITIPAAVRKLLNINTGNKVIISNDQNSITIKPLPKEVNVMDLYASIKSKSKHPSPENEIYKTKKIKAIKTATQKYI